MSSWLKGVVHLGRQVKEVEETAACVLLRSRSKGDPLLALSVLSAFYSNKDPNPWTVPPAFRVRLIIN